MVTNANVQYNEGSTKTERTPIRCKKTGKLLARFTGAWPDGLRQWLWCRNCHMEHEVTSEYITSN